MNLLYIAGYGRSGSTLLDRLLSDRSGIPSAGELGRLFGHAGRSDRLGFCSCGVTYRECPRWGAVLARAQEAAAGATLVALERLTRAVEAVDPRDATPSRGRRASQELSAYDAVWSAVLDAAATSFGSGYLVDSSKTTPRGSGYRPAHLACITGKPVLVIHLVRDPVAVLHSAKRGRNKDLEGEKDLSWTDRQMNQLRSWATWRGSNRIARKLTTFPGIRAVELSYEQLCADPERCWSRVRSVAEELWGAFPPATSDRALGEHGIGGNRMRRSALAEMRPDVAWMTEASRETRWLGGLNRHWFEKSIPGFGGADRSQVFPR